MFSHKNTEAGSSLVLAIIILLILTALGLMSIDVADMNIMTAANDRDAKNAFILADAGANVGHEILEADLHQNGTPSLCNDVSGCLPGTCDAQCWINATVGSFTANDTVSWPTEGRFYTNGTTGIFLRVGRLSTNLLEGAAIQVGAGYEGVGKSAAHGGSFTLYLVRSHYEGDRLNRAEVDLGWRHVNN
jgi:hypothetical protein